MIHNAVIHYNDLKLTVKIWIKTRTFLKYVLNLINIYDPLPAHWTLRDFPRTSTPSPLTRQLQNKMMPVVKMSPQLQSNNNTLTPSLLSLQNHLNASCNSHSSACVAKQWALRSLVASLCVATCCTGFTELLIPNKDARAAAVWAEAMRIGHANQLAKGSKRLKN